MGLTLRIQNTKEYKYKKEHETGKAEGWGFATQYTSFILPKSSLISLNGNLSIYIIYLNSTLQLSLV